MAKDLTLELNTSNLGPHVALNTKLQMSNMEIGIYANNGIGKTFLSRTFRLATKPELLADDSNRLLTMGKTQGRFKIKITSKKEPNINRELEIDLNRGTPPVIAKDTTGYLFRVFNDEYVNENLEVSKYRPDGQIEGYILGKEKIDLTNEKEELANLQSDLEKKEQRLKSGVDTGRKELDQFSIRRNTQEYINFNYNNLFNPNYNATEQESFEQLTKMHNQLKALPDDLPDLKNIDQLKSTNTLFNITSYLEEKFSRSTMSEEFKLKIKQKQDFVETGIALLEKDRNECPFCEQDLAEEAIQLINQYEEYLSETEAQQIKKANELIRQLDNEKKTNSNLYKEVVKLQNDYMTKQKFIPSLSESNLNEIADISELDVHYETLKQALEKKKEDITTVVLSEDINKAVKEIKGWINSSNQSIAANSSVVQMFNDRKNDTRSERLVLNRRLCRARFDELKKAENDLIKRIAELRTSIKELEGEILTKEQSQKISKKEKVVETFKSLLSKFFGVKYAFDEDSFCLKFQNQLLESNASDVLSSGEKSIVAFCYYLAETHKFVEKEEDYEKLFFVIDDPVSSQDFHFVYTTSQIIRNLNKTFDIPRLRLILFTHNLEFMSIIIRNRIIEQKFVLSGGKIEKLRNELIMPYEEHLRDIYDISQAVKNPCHTTPNSLRHILETINRFIAPDLELSSFCEEIDGYADNEFLYSLIQDASHGGIRLQKAYTEEMIKSACDVVVNYVSSDFAGQIKHISNL